MSVRQEPPSAMIDRPMGESTQGDGSSSRQEAARAAAFRHLAETHLDENYRLARSILGRNSDAEDVVHDAFETAWRKWPSLRDPDRFPSWFGRIVVNACRDRLRRSVRRRTEEISDVVRAPDDPVSAEDRDELDRGIAQLRPDDQIVLALRYQRDLKVDDIATLIGVRPGTVMSRIHRATERLRTILNESKGDVS